MMNYGLKMIVNSTYIEGQLYLKCVLRFVCVSNLILFFLISFELTAVGQSTTDIEIQEIVDSIESAIKTDFVKSMLLFESYTGACEGLKTPECSRDSLQLIKAKILLEGARYYKMVNVDTARILIDQSKNIYSKLDKKRELHDALYTSGSIHYMDGTNKDGINEFEKYIQYHSLHDNTLEKAKGQFKKASCYRRMGVQDSTITYLHKALPVFEEQKEMGLVANCYQIFGIVYTGLSQFELAQRYLNDGLKIFENENDLGGQARILTCMGNNRYAQKDTLGCIPYYKSAGKLNQKANIIEGIFVNYYNTANAFFQLAKYDSSLVYVDKANEYKDQLGQRHKYMIKYKQGTIFIELERFEKGIELLEEAFETALGLNGYIDARDMSNYLSRGYASLDDYNSAYNYSMKYAELKDSVITIESNKSINELKAKYESEKKEIQIQNLELVNSQQYKMLIGGGLALGLISVLTFFLYRLYQRVNEQKTLISKALKEKDILLREIHHRVKNNLQLVSSLLTLQGRSIDDSAAQQAINEGKNRVRSMALIHQDLYNKENLMGIGVKQYLEKLTIELFQTYRIDQDRIKLFKEIQNIELDVDTMVPLGLIINELITNSLKYAFSEDKTGMISVKLQEVDSKLQLSIKDNGIGYSQSNVRENSFGSTLISALTEQLGGEMVINSDDGTETIITFHDYEVIN